MRCIICRKGPSDGVNVLHRVNAKGQPGIWACSAHVGQTDANIDPETARIAQIIGGER